MTNHCHLIVQQTPLQVSPNRKAGFRQMLSEAIRIGTKGIFIHDVEVTFTWYIEEDRRSKAISPPIWTT